MKTNVRKIGLKSQLKTQMMIILLSFLTIIPTSAYAFRDDVLVIVNDNSVDSPQIGSYYAQQRNINPANIVHVRIRNGYFIDWDEFRSLRDQIIAFMQANTLDNPDLTPTNCVDGDIPYYCSASMQQLRQHTKIRYLVTTRGIPTRMKVSGSKLFAPNAATSVDNYLKYWLINYFATDVKLTSSVREQVFLDGRGMRTVIPSVDKELIIGRIDGLNQVAALNLVDRAIEAEENGLYGNLFGNTQAINWIDYSTTTNGFPKRVYLPKEGIQESWRYQLGLFGESRIECLEYLNFPLTMISGLTPPECQVQITPAAEKGPGKSPSRQPVAINALMYFGWLDDSVSAPSFNKFLNWRTKPSCDAVLCENTVVPEFCSKVSSDIHHEINTRCAGVAKGFIGSNHQSYPVSFFASWPTSWYPDSNTKNWNTLSGGDSLYGLAFPEIIDFYGLGDKFSLWFRSSDQVKTTECYTDTSFTSTTSCPDQRRINLNQKISFPEKSLDATNPLSFRISFWYRAFNVTTATDLQARFFVHESNTGNQQIDYGIQTIGHIPLGHSNWRLASIIYTLDPAQHGSLLYDGIKLRLQSSGLFAGDLVIDIISITDPDTNQELVHNGHFGEGHQQVAMGDYAAKFLSRLNGTAFWGSVSHHQSGGSAFGLNQLETLIYFMRGLPLGDAVWFNESNNSGILYGDPLYSPVSIYLHPVNTSDNLKGTVELVGNVVNGQAPAFVETHYAVDYCTGTDFFTCDQNPSTWLSTGINGVGGQKNMPLGSWDTSAIIPGEFVLRLAVTSNNLSTGKTQTFYDYYPVTIGVINYPPVATASRIFTNEDTTGSSQILVTDQNENDTHSFTIIGSSFIGTATVSTNGLISYTPLPDKNGNDIVQVTITDSAGSIDFIRVRVIVNAVNDAPRPAARNRLIREDSILTNQIQPNDPDIDDVAIYSIVSTPVLGSATVSSSGLVTYTPDANLNGIGSVTTNVKDASGASADITFYMKVAAINDVPVLEANNIEMLEDSSTSTQIHVFDPDINDSHSYNITILPLHGSAQISVNGLISYTPNTGYIGTDQITVTVSDTAGGTANIAIDIKVNSVIVSFPVQSNSSVVIKGLIEDISADGWITILGKPVYLAQAKITYKSDSDNPVFNIGDHLNISAATNGSNLVANTVVRNNNKNNVLVRGSVSHIDTDNIHLGIAFIDIKTDANTQYKNFESNLEPIASITENTILRASELTLATDGKFVAGVLEIM